MFRILTILLFLGQQTMASYACAIGPWYYYFPGSPERQAIYSKNKNNEQDERLFFVGYVKNKRPYPDQMTKIEVIRQYTGKEKLPNTLNLKFDNRCQKVIELHSYGFFAVKKKNGKYILQSGYGF